ncbi:cation diffusion facilitator family transporter [Cupriavidus respiraculi]|uniref:Metal cation efflux system protein CzcD n=1 Tax=Cupriavidus respiraculi TaxID=195930 RepID=A0ABM8XU18_9BURK|nr:cation diffusion facilitator family transporter [Cupriavidus respiraculi]MBY4949490.1 cation diffusion facilitator family transporter [Cupriavidus respiraculi]CAG9183853.1 Metal cation efflux system protein CzcD [Cupriavidus respiraculi]
MGAGHDHGHATGNERALKWALGLTATFLVVELVGGLLTQSLALISDAAHMFTDTAALAIALAAIQIAKRPVDKARTFGYYRFEILAAALNALLLFGVALYILYEAYQRLQSPPDIESTGMLLIAVVGLVVNFASMRILAGGKDHSLNVKGAYLEVWSDLLGSLGVIIGALIIRFTGWAWVDTVVAVMIGLWVLPRTWILLKSSLNILLEGVPEEIEIGRVEEALRSIRGVKSIHDLHVWALTSGKVSLTVHVVNDAAINAEREILPAIRDLLAQQFGITHITVQCELAPCRQADRSVHFESAAHYLQGSKIAEGKTVGPSDLGR